jgi:hypothetical protein
VSISGDTIIAGVEFLENTFDCSAGASIFTRSGGNWGQTAELVTPTNAYFESYYPYSCAAALNGNLAVVGAARDNSNGIFHGSVSIYSRSDDVWSFVEKRTIDAEAGEDLFGESVALDAEFLLIGAPNTSDPEAFCGAAYAIDLRNFLTLPWAIESGRSTEPLAARSAK